MSSTEPPIRQFYGVEYIDLETHRRNVDDLTSAIVKAMEVAGGDILELGIGNVWHDMLLKFAPEKLDFFEFKPPPPEAPHILGPDDPRPLEVRVLEISANGSIDVDHWPSWFREALSDEKIRRVTSMPVDGNRYFVEVLTSSGWVLCEKGNIIVNNALGWMTVRETPPPAKEVNLREVKVISLGSSLKDIETDHSPAWFEQSINTGRVTLRGVDGGVKDKYLQVKVPGGWEKCRVGETIFIDDAGNLDVNEEII